MSSELSTPNVRDCYVELPYALPQDSNRFPLLREQNAEIWLRKPDRVAKNGGMALMNIHPDYLCFNGSIRNGQESPCDYYRQFLEEVIQKFKWQHWHPIPNQLASWYRQTLPRTVVPNLALSLA